jgi:hypothetical protein
VIGIVNKYNKENTNNRKSQCYSSSNKPYCFNEMKQPLLSIPLLPDDGCKISLTANNITVTKNNKTILKGIRDTVSTLWMIPIKHHRKALLLAQDLPPVPILHAANSAYHQPTIAKLMAFHNATIGSLPVKTLCNAIDNDWLTSFTGLTSKVNQKAPTKIHFNSNGTSTHD